MLRKDTVVSEVLKVITELQANQLFEHYYLAGGTALALQLGHRTSTDVDLFTYSNSNLFEINKYFSKYPEKYKITHNLDGFMRLYIDGIKVDLIHDDIGRLLYEPVKEGGIAYLNIRDIAPMKLKAAVNRGKGRDFIDMAYLLKEISMTELFSLYKEKYGNVNINILKKELLLKSKAVKDDEWLAGIKLIKNDIDPRNITNIVKYAINEYNNKFDIGMENRDKYNVRHKYIDKEKELDNRESNIAVREQLVQGSIDASNTNQKMIYIVASELKDKQATKPEINAFWKKVFQDFPQWVSDTFKEVRDTLKKESHNEHTQTKKHTQKR